MANENSKTPTQAQPQMIPLSKIHELPGVFNPKPQDKTLGSMVLSIESNGVKEAVILRQRSDGEYELLSGYRRRRASELAKKQDIPAHVYEMTMQEAIAYRKAVKQNPNAPIPGKLVVPNADKDMAFAVPSEKPKEDKAPATPGEKPKEGKAPAADKHTPTVLHLLDLGYKATNERVSRMKKAEAGGQKLDEMTLRSVLDDKDIAPKQPEPVKQPEAPAAPTAGTEQPPIPASPDIPAAPDAPPTEDDVPPWEEPEKGTTQEQGGAQPAPVPGTPVPGAAAPEQEDDPLKGPQERPEVTKVILTGDRLRKYFPDVSMTPREIEESVYSALEERRQRQLKEQQKATIFKRGGPTR